MAPEFVQRGELTAEGQKVIAHIEGLFAQVMESKEPDAYNGQPGHVKHYFANVLQLKSLTPEKWLESYGNAASAAWRDIETAEAATAQAETIKEADARVTELETKFNALAETLKADMEAQVKSVKESIEEELATMNSILATMAGKKSRKPQPMPTEEPAEMEAES